jgi:hypothetical protein
MGCVSISIHDSVGVDNSHLETIFETASDLNCAD